MRSAKSANTNPGQTNVNTNTGTNQNSTLRNNNRANNRNDTSSNDSSQSPAAQSPAGSTTKSSIADILGGRQTSQISSARKNASKTNTRESILSRRRIGGTIGSRSSNDASNVSTARETKRTRENKTGLVDSQSIASEIRGRNSRETSSGNSAVGRNRQSDSTGTRSAWSILRRSNNAKKKDNNRAADTNSRDRQSAARELRNKNSDSSRRQKDTSTVRSSATSGRTTRNNDRTSIARSQKSIRDRASQHIYDDRPNLIRHSNKNVYAYRDRLYRTHYRVVKPSYHYLLCYDWGWHHTYRYFYPYYHRKYIFVSLCGYWPYDYPYLRYYWYGYHPYYWYGYYPIAREVEGDTYNYYTYNYYYDDTLPAQSALPADDIQPVDHNTFADVREKLAQQQAEAPAGPTPADVYFENAVKAFEAGDFNLAASQFAEAMKLAPDDMILPFAYSQALLANERYSEAANVLREALSKVTPEKEGVFYPRGLYANDEKLNEQIDLLTEKANLYSDNADLQLLLGYQLLGIGRTDEAFTPLWNASRDPANAKAATVLLELRETIINNDNESTGSDTEQLGETENSDGAISAENTNDGIISSASDEIINAGGAIRLKETVFMATLLTIITGSGIYHYIRC